jgi:4-hydroxybenzoate polyprenyltransferase
MPWLKLVRWRNLLIILFTQWLAWRCVIVPLSPSVLDAVSFCYLALSTLLIAAAGYAINDYFDIRIDIINRPEDVVLEVSIPRKSAIIAHTIMNVVALVLAAMVAARAHHYEWLLLQAGCTLLLWFYSTHLKRQYMTGNIAVALLTALTILTLVVYEPELHRLSMPFWILATYSCFAFLLTWVREITKDMEDYRGDDAEGCVTMPIKKGLAYSTTFIRVLMAAAILSVSVAAILLFSWHYYLLGIYSVVVLALPMLVWAIFVGRSYTTAHYATASRWLKAIMVLGVCSLLIYYLQPA